ncbi:hypothetical protein CY35_17G063100 [Sphagnum magellanicum]|nr:hypothetical protein CY35_17G063100 [Sphagnum magellanicum]
MDPYEATRNLYARVQTLEPENGSKIMLHLLLQEHGEQEMLRMSMGSDALLEAMVNKAKMELGLEGCLRPHPAPLYIPEHGSNYANELQSPSLHEQLNLTALQQHGHEQQLLLHDHQLPLMHENLSLWSDVMAQQQGLFAQPSANPLYSDTYASFLNSSKELNLHPRSSSSRASPIVQDTSSLSSSDVGLGLAWKPCLYFARGYCKHGSNCRFLHGGVAMQRESSGSSPASSNGHIRGVGELRIMQDDHDGLTPGSLERLEMELQELLRGRRAPVSIASLPQLYYERFSKNLQAEGYLTESQRHGKAGYSLTKLLARLKNTVTLIDRAYGPVQDVRIPYQQKRMFGFVTFVYSETVITILTEGNPHYICGARVLVKPYREKGKHGDRKYTDRGDHTRYVQNHSIDGKEYDYQSLPKLYEEDEAFSRQMEEEQALELEHRCLMELHMASAQQRRAEAEASMAMVAAQNRSLVTAGFPANELSLPGEGLSQFHSNKSFEYLLDVLDNNEPVVDEHDTAAEAFIGKQSSGNGQTLPDSAFINPLGTRKLLTLSENMSNLSLQSGQVGATKAAKAADLARTCCVCMEYVGDTVQLECSHAFCVQCVLKVGNEECPACAQAATLGQQQQQGPVTQLRDALQWSWASPRQLW